MAELVKSMERNDSIVLIDYLEMASFRKRLEALNKKAEAFGLDPIKIIDMKDVAYKHHYEEGGRSGITLCTLVPVREGEQIRDPVLLKRIEIEYPIIKLGNWRVVGSLRAVEGGNLMFSVTQDADDVEALTSRAEHPIECEHCKTNRRRNDGYLLRDIESGEYKQVGGNCLENFTGIDPAAALFLTRMYTVIDEFRDDYEGFRSSGRVNAVNTRDYLVNVSFIAENKGFVSKAMARDRGILSTSHNAMPSELRGWLREDTDLGRKYVEQIERHEAKADAIRDWIAVKETDSPFDHNVKLLLQADQIPLDSKCLGFAAAAVPMYNRALAQKAEVEKPSEHVGKPGQKINTNLTVDRVMTFETRYGMSDLVLMHDEAGNKFKWKTSACPQEIRERAGEGAGKTMEASFKIKEHDNYNGVAQTTITHLKVDRWLDVDVEAENDLTDEMLAEQKYNASIYRHEDANAALYGDIVLDHAPFSADGLIAEARRRGIDQRRTEGEFTCFASAPDAQGRTYSLHLHEVDGHAPTDDDYRNLAVKLGIERAEYGPDGLERSA